MGRLILLVGKTSSGKDTIARYIKDAYGINQVVSYTTRPKRPNETNGVEHFFVSKDEMQKILATQDILAYTKFNDTEYCATAQQLKGSDSDRVYIIDPHGIKELQKKGLDMITIYVDLDEYTILDRAIKRGDILDTVKARLHNEREQFDNFKARKSYDFLISTNCDLEFVYSKVDSILNKSGFRKI